MKFLCRILLSAFFLMPLAQGAERSRCGTELAHALNEWKAARLDLAATPTNKRYGTSSGGTFGDALRASVGAQQKLVEVLTRAVESMNAYDPDAEPLLIFLRRSDVAIRSPQATGLADYLKIFAADKTKEFGFFQDHSRDGFWFVDRSPSGYPRVRFVSWESLQEFKE